MNAAKSPSHPSRLSRQVRNSLLSALQILPLPSHPTPYQIPRTTDPSLCPEVIQRTRPEHMASLSPDRPTYLCLPSLDCSSNRTETTEIALYLPRLRLPMNLTPTLRPRLRRLHFLVLRLSEIPDGERLARGMSALRWMGTVHHKQLVAKVTALPIRIREKSDVGLSMRYSTLDESKIISVGVFISFVMPLKSNEWSCRIIHHATRRIHCLYYYVPTVYLARYPLYFFSAFGQFHGCSCSYLLSLLLSIF